MKSMCASVNDACKKYFLLRYSSQSDNEAVNMNSGKKKTSIYVNENYKEDLNLSIHLMKWTMKTIGVWPSFSNKMIATKLLSRLIRTVCFGFIIFIVVPCFLHLVLEVEDTYLKIRLSGPLSFYFMAFAKFYYLINHGSIIKKCVRQIEADWRNIKFFDDHQIMINSAIFGRRLATICATFMYGSGVFYYIILPFFAGKIVSEDGNSTYRPLPVAVAKMIADVQKNPTDDIFCVLQCIGGLISHAITVSACCLAAVFIMHACGQLEVLVSFLGRLVDGTEDVFSTIDERIMLVVEHHVRTLNFIACVQKLIREISLVEIAGCTLNMCLLGYYVITEWGNSIHSLTYVILLMSFAFNIFIFCYIGELLMQQYDRVGQMTYMIEWYRIPGRDSLSIILTMLMSNSSTKITAGNLFDLSLACFGDVMKTSVAYLNMLRTLTM